MYTNDHLFPLIESFLNPLFTFFLEVTRMAIVNNSLNVDIKYQVVKELEEEIKREFINVLKNNVIDPYKTNVALFGENFVFLYVYTKRFNHTICFKFEVYRRKDFRLSNKHHNLSIGTVYVDVEI